MRPLAQIAEAYQYLFGAVMFMATLYVTHLLSVHTESTMLIGMTLSYFLLFL